MRVESRREAVELADVGISKAIAGAVEEFSPASRRRTLEVIVLGHLPPVSSDPSLLHHILRNLFENAVRHTPDATAITLTGTSGRIVISVEDEGTGIPAASQEKIFEPFSKPTPHQRRSGVPAELAKSPAGRAQRPLTSSTAPQVHSAP